MQIFAYNIERKYREYIRQKNAVWVVDALEPKEIGCCSHRSFN